MGTPASTTYVTTELSNWESISRVVYGDESYADVIKAANPVVFEPIAANLLLTIPILPLAPPPQPGVPGLAPVPQPLRVKSVPFNDRDDVALLIDGVAFDSWESVTIHKSVDKFSTVSFTAPFESDDPQFRDLLKPLSFSLIQLFVGGSPYFFGRMLPVSPKVDADKRTVDVSCYSYAGTLNDCTAGIEQDKSFNDIDLYDISRSLCRPFAISVIEPHTYDTFDPENPDPYGEDAFYDRFNELSIKASQKILNFLTGLAAQRKLVITDNANGDLVFDRVVQGSTPVAHLQEGQSPLTGVDLAFDTQGWYSDVTGVQAGSAKPGIINTMLKSVDSGTPVKLTNYTVHNEFLPGVYRPYVFVVQDSDGPVVDQTKAKYARMIANVVTYTVEVSGWRDPGGQLWSANTLIDVTCPSAMIYTRYRFLIKSVSLSKDANKKTATLKLGLPGSFTGTPPTRLPWQA